MLVAVMTVEINGQDGLTNSRCKPNTQVDQRLCTVQGGLLLSLGQDPTRRCLNTVIGWELVFSGFKPRNMTAFSHKSAYRLILVLFPPLNPHLRRAKVGVRISRFPFARSTSRSNRLLNKGEPRFGSYFRLGYSHFYSQFPHSHLSRIEDRPDFIGWNCDWSG